MAKDMHQAYSRRDSHVASLMAVSAKPELVENRCVVANVKVGQRGAGFSLAGSTVYPTIENTLTNIARLSFI